MDLELGSAYEPENNLELFAGREKEISILRKSLLVDKVNVVAVSGHRGSGKTALWKVFLNLYKDTFADIEIIYGYPYSDVLPALAPIKGIVVLEELAYGMDPDSVNEVKKFVQNNPEKQFILVEDSNFIEKLDSC